MGTPLNFLWTVLTLVMFFSCINVTTDKTDISKKDTIMLDSATVLLDSESNTFTNCLGNQIAFKCLAKCGDGSPTNKKGNESSPFNVKNTISGDTTKIEFHFADDCGRTYFNHSSIKGDTVYLEYESNSPVIIEAYCEYYYQFLLPHCKWTTIYLMGKEIFFYDFPSHFEDDTLSDLIEQQCQQKHY